MSGPRRRVVGDQTHTWASQAPQYERSDVPRREGIVLWQVPQGEVPVPIVCLLHYSPGEGALQGMVQQYRDSIAVLTGILNYFPEGSPYGEDPHDVVLLVREDHRRMGIGTALLLEAMDRWPEIDLESQSFTKNGWALAQTLL